MHLHHVEVIPIKIPVKKELRIKDAYGWKGESYYNIVKIFDHEGRVGIGEATFTDVWSGERQEGSKEAIEQVLYPSIKEMNFFDIRAMVKRMDEVLYGHLSSKAAVEMALYDLIGKVLNVPLYNVLGGRIRESLPLKFSIAAVDDVKLLSRQVAFALNQGIRTVKVKVGTEIEKDIARVKTIYSEFGDRVRIAIDANSAWRLDQAKKVVKDLDVVPLLFIEQPLSRDDIIGIQALQNVTDIPIVIDEGVFTMGQAWNYMREGVGDAISVYPGKNGGLIKSQHILSMVHATHKTALVGSNLELGIASSAMVHLGVVYEGINDNMYPSDIIGPLYHEEDIITDPLSYKSGAIIPPEGPGLGVNIDEEKLQFFKLN